MMKVKLEALQVESFETTAEENEARGTVNGHEALQVTVKFSCPPRYTCPECAPRD